MWWFVSRVGGAVVNRAGGRKERDVGFMKIRFRLVFGLMCYCFTLFGLLLFFFLIISKSSYKQKAEAKITTSQSHLA